ncbi:MAG: SCO family protein [Solirubrobacteraceae bacterium]|jgi:protein SCO1/2
MRRRDLIGLLVGLAVLGVVLALVFRAPASVRAPGGVATAANGGRYEGLALSHEEAAPPLALDNYLGTPVNLAEYRGKAVLVTFLYTHCPDVCPLIASHLHTALAEMGAPERRKLQIIAVSVDPRGDTPSTVAEFLAAHRMTGQMQYLIGSAAALRPVWKRWGIADAATASAANPDLIAHTALVYGITGRGRIAVIYASNFTPGEIVHDARVLAGA